MWKYLVTSCLLGLSLTSCGSKPKIADNSSYVKVFTIGNQIDNNFSTFHGVIHAEYEPNLSFRVNGKIISRAVDIGEVVTYNQELAKLDPTDYKLSEGTAKAQLDSSYSNYLTQKANLERYRELLKQNFVSQAQYDAQKAQYEAAKSQYQSAKNQVANSTNQVAYTILRAPESGVITSVNMDAGQVVTAGTTVATMAVSGSKEVEIEIPENQINSYKIGMPAKIKMWASSKEYQGKIKNINQASDPKTRTYTARVTINNADSQVKYGMAADVTVMPLNEITGILLPLSALYAYQGKSYVWVLGNNEEAKLVQVTVLSTNGNSMQVQVSELKAGDKIVSAGTNLIYVGQKLKIYEN